MLYCIACHGDLISSSPDLRVCSHCGKQYPSIDGIDVFILPDAISSLSAYVREIDDSKAEFIATSESLSAFEKTAADGVLSERIARNLSGMAANLDVLEALYQPIVDFVQDHPSQDNGLTSYTLKSGYTGAHMLAYFYQDWCNLPEYEAVKKQICQAATTHCRTRDKVAVLGAGACGLLYSVADYFQLSYGVDLSLPGLLTAKKLIEGNPLSFHLKEANWQEVNVLPPALPAHEIRFMTADAMTLPFKSGTLSVVITQYLLDIVSNTELFSQEIHRVLEPGGVWINFSKPFKVHSPAELGRYRLAELPDYFKQRGFAVEQMACPRFTPLNPAALDAESDSINDAVHFFTLRKCAQPMPMANAQSAGRFFTGSNGVWHEIPRIVKGREISFLQKRSLSDRLPDEPVWLNVMAKLFAVPADLALLLEALFALMDGEKTLKELFAIVQSREIGITEAQFLVLIYCLNRQYALIELSAVSHDVAVSV